MRVMLVTGTANGREWEIGDELTIGREASCDVVVGEGSLPHGCCVRIVRAGEDVLVEVLGAGAPVHLAGEPLSPGELRSLSPNARLEFGNASFIVLDDGVGEPGPEEREEHPFPRDRLVFVGEIVEAILRQGNRATFFERILDAVFHTLDVRRGFILLAGERTDETHVVASRSLESEDPGQEFHASGTILGRVLREGRALLLADARRSMDLAASKSVIGFDIRSVLCVPIVVRGKPEGVIYADNRTREASFSRTDLEFLTMIGRLAAVVLENLDRRERQDRRIRELQARLDRGGVEFVHRSAAMDRALDAARRFAGHDTTVLITGESGTGKELVARTIHNLSPRRDRDFVAINCAGVVDTLLETELFGHERGSFTGALDRRIGRFESADGGTLFLDEIGEMSPAMQAKLLRVLEGHPFERVGGTESVEVNVRVLAATNRDLHVAVRNGTFRQDLLFRIRRLTIDLLPLRQRPDDILVLARHFLERMSTRPLRIGTAAEEALVRYPWPGNVRELRNAIEHAMILCRRRTIRPEDLPREIVEAPIDPVAVRTVDEVVREHARRTYRDLGGNLSRTARALGVARNTLRKYLGEG